MAPNDREDRRRQRARGAGTRQLGAAGFSFALPQASKPLAPRPSSRRTPQPGPPSAKSRSGSSRRQRSASIPKSSAKSAALKPNKTPRSNATPSKFKTPIVTGKRKRVPQDDPNAPDELEQNDEEHMASSARKDSGSRPARASSAHISPRERDDTAPDELEANGDDHMVSSGSKRRRTEQSISMTPVESTTNDSVSTSRKSKRALAPIEEIVAQRSESIPTSGTATSTQATVQTPSNRPLARQRKEKATKRAPVEKGRTEGENEEIDELSPDKQAKTAGPRTTAAELDDVEIDELSPDKPEKTARNRTTRDIRPNDEDVDELSPDKAKTSKSKTRARPKTAAVAPQQGRRVRKEVVQVQDSQPEQEEQAPDELSPEAEKTRPKPSKRKPHQKVIELEPPAEELEREAEDELATPATSQQPLRERGTQQSEITRPSVSATAKTTSRARTGSTGIGAKRARVPVTVYRMFYPKKGKSTEESAIDDEPSKSETRVMGISGVDVIAEYFNQLLDKEVKEYFKRTERSKNRDQRRQNRSRMILVQDFKHTMEDQFLDLAEAVDAGTGFKKCLQVKTRDKLRAREELLDLRQQREEVLLKMDELREEQEERKASRIRNESLNEAFFDIEAAISTGRAKAKKDGREDEGPEIPLEMLLEDVARDVGSEGAGLLENVRGFNGVLERAAGLLEGRV